MAAGSHSSVERLSADIEKAVVLQDTINGASEHEHQLQDSGLSQEANSSQDVETKPPTPQQNTSVTDWNGPDDPDNPHNWSTWNRVYHATIPALFGFAVYVSQSSSQPCSHHTARSARQCTPPP
jgi:hypothetical protein